MNLIGLLFLLITQFITGRGLIRLFRLQLTPLHAFCFSMLCGVAIFSFVPFFMELAHIDLTVGSMSVALGITTAIFMVPLLGMFKGFKMPALGIKMPSLYELPFFVIIGLLMFLSVWRCYFYGPVARDMTSGPEAMAEFALREKHMINSYFTIDLTSTNNYLKPPFITSLQIIYKMFVQQFGQVWLSVLFVNFIVVLASLLKEKLHGVIVGFLMLYFIAIPELFAYTYLMLFDYSNMIFFFSGFYFLGRYINSNQVNEFAFAVFLFAIATYIRTETLILVGMVVPFLLFMHFRDKVPVVKSLMRVGVLMLASYVVYFLCMSIFVKYYIPVKYDVSSDVNKNLGDLGPLFTRIYEMYDQLIFSDIGKVFYGYFFHVFLLVLLVDAIFFRKYTKEGALALYAVAITFFGLAFIGYLLPLADLMHTTKRGMFKIFPLMMLYFRNSGSLLSLTSLLNNWENGTSTKQPQSPYLKPQPAAQAPASAPQPTPSKKKK